MPEISKLDVRREIEWRRCAKDPVHFLNTYWHIETVGKGYEISGLREYQEQDVALYLEATRGDAKDHQARLKARQIGYTTVASGFAFWDAYFHQNHPWLIAQQSEDEAKRTLFSKVKLPYTMLPAWMKDRGPKVLVDNTEEIRFDNGSGITAIHSGSSAARGRATYGVIMDEAAFMDDGESLFGALDPLCYGVFLLFSTANGMGNFFHDIWQDAQLSDSEWESGFYPWDAVPGRTEEWYNRTKRRYRGREWLFFQEYPSTPAEAFAKSGRTALPIDLLEDEQDWCPPEARYDISALDIYFETDRTVLRQLQDAIIPEEYDERDLELWVWEHPYTERDEFDTLLRKPNFVVGVDVSEGLEDGDYSAISVKDANSLETVATVRAHVPVEDLGALAEWLGYWYYTALIGVERNNQGLVPLQHLARRHYPRLYRMDSIAQQKRSSRTPRYGWHTNKATKPKMVIDFTKGLRDGVIDLHDERFLKEARTFLADGKGGFGASAGNHDDALMAELVAYQMCLESGQYPIVYEDRTDPPVTFDDVFGLMMSSDQQQGRGSSPLYQPIGQASPERFERVGRSWLMKEANIER